MATITLALSVVAVSSARHHAALTDEFQSANAGTLNVERVNGLIYAVQSAARGVAMSPDIKSAAPYGADLGKFNDQIDKVISRLAANRSSRGRRLFQTVLHPPLGVPEFRARTDAHRRGVGPKAARDWAEKNFPADARNELTHDLDTLSRQYADRARQSYTQMEHGIDATALWLSLLAAFAVMLASVGSRHDPPQRGQAACRHYPHHRTGRRRRGRRFDSVQRAPRRDRRAGAIDRRLPARHAA